MSTKTTFKRVALVAVASLGFGVLSSIAPANAFTSGLVITIGTPTANKAVVGVEVTITTPITLTTVTANDTFVISAVLQAKPTADTTTVTDSITAVVVSKSNVGSTSATTTTGDITGTIDNTGVASNIYTAGPGTYAAGSINSSMKFTPLNAGTYTFAVFIDGASGITANGAIKAADTVRYISITAVAAPAVSTVITQPLAGSVATSGTGRTNGAVLKIGINDAAGVATRVDTSQQVLVNLPSGVSITAVNGSAVTATTQYGLVSSNFSTSGFAYINVANATAGTYAITSNLAGSATVSTVSVTFVTPTGFSAAGSGALQPDGSSSGAGAVKAGVGSGVYTSTAAATIVRTQTSTTITAFGTTTAKVLMLTATDTAVGRIFGSTAGLSQDMVATGATSVIAATAEDGSAGSFPATFTITHTALASLSTDDAATTGFTVSPQDTSVTTAPSALNMALTGVAAAAASSFWDTALPTSTYLVVNGGSITIAADLYNQYAAVLTGTAVTAQITAGRNVQAAATNLVTDSAGNVTFTVADATPTSATTYSTVTFTGGGATADVTINYVAALTAATMTTSPSATTTTAVNPSDLGGVNTATATASTGRDAVTATLLDAAGVAIVGMPVTLTVPADVTLYSLTPAVAYTSSTGVATWSVYTTKAGTYKFTATGGGLTKDFYGKWSGSNGRVLSVTAGTSTGDVTPVTIKVSDAYGNGVGSIAVSVSATGGYFQGVALSSSISTNTSGEIKVAFVGNGTVTVSATETHMFYGAALVGTTAAAGFPAGVSSASVTVAGGSNTAADNAQAATDAAAEATDAANAATDAANAAAEAADAATAAAQDAADAVAALSAQVATLISGLKAQLTALTNLIIKIQKKVKA